MTKQESLPRLNAELENLSFLEKQIIKCRAVCEQYGGSHAILDQIASGVSEVAIAKSIGISLLSLKAYLRNTVDPSDLEAARSAHYEIEFSDVRTIAQSIPDEKKKFDAMMEVTSYMADKSTLHFKEKAKDANNGNAITITVDWNSIGRDAPMVIDVGTKE